MTFIQKPVFSGCIALFSGFATLMLWSNLVHAVEDQRWDTVFEDGNGCFGTVYAVAPGPDDILFVGGDLNSCGDEGLSPGNIAAFHADSGTWSALGNGLNDRVNALAYHDGSLYAGGVFTQIQGGGAAFHIARWDTDTEEWHPVGNNGNGLDDRILAMAIMDDDLYVGGQFQEANTGSNSVDASHIARWDGSNWSALQSPTGEGVSSIVWDITADGSRLFLAGFFTQANMGDPITVNRVALWENNAWSGLTGNGGVGVSGTARRVAVVDDDVYVAGAFSEANTGNPIAANRIARWDGSNWSQLADASGQGVDERILAMTVFEGDVYVSGHFENFGDVNPTPASRIARWDGSQWHALGSGLDSGSHFFGRALTTDNQRHVYVGGIFNTAGGHSSRSIARYAARGEVQIELSGNGNGTVTSLPSGIDCPGDCLANFDWDTSMTLNASPDFDSEFDGFSGSGCGTASNCQFDLVEDATVTATFSLKTYTIDVVPASGQGVFSTDTPVVDHGDTASGVLQPDPGWSVYSLTGDSCSPDDNGDGTWTAAGIVQDCTVEAVFRPDTSLALSTDSQPAVIGQPVTYTVEVAGTSSAPVDGQITVLADTGELCLDNSTPAAGTGNTVIFSCQIQFSGTGTRSMTAEYDNSSTHMPGASLPLQQNVAPSDELFEDRFEMN